MESSRRAPERDQIENKMKKDNFTPIFNKLKTILKEYECEMVLKVNTADQYYLDTQDKSH